MGEEEVEEEEEREVEEEESSISIESSWASKFNYPIVIPVSTLSVRWNRSSTASLEGIRSVEGQSNWNQTKKKWYVVLNKPIDSYWARKFNYPMSVHQGSAGISRQLHPLKAKYWNWLSSWGSKYVFLPDNAIDWFFFRSLHLHLSVRSLICLSVS